MTTAQKRHVSLSELILMDRYARKGNRTDLSGSPVIAHTGELGIEREFGVVVGLDDDHLTAQVKTVDGVMTIPTEQLDPLLETTPEQVRQRVAHELASVESHDNLKAVWGKRFAWLMEDWKFVPGGRILAGAGDRSVSTYNCFVLPSPKDSRGGIMETLLQMTEIMSRGGGVGINVSSLRPRHAYVKGVNGRSSGSVSWGALYSFVTGLIEQGGSRRGALMIILDDWHPDVLEFINSKRTMGQITNANISVALSDAFMEAVRRGDEWSLVFPDTTDPDYDELWTGNLADWQAAGKATIFHKSLPARELWQQIIESAHASAEPGIFFVDRYNTMSNSHYYAPIRCTNPCSEQGLPPWGVCNLGAINLSQFVITEKGESRIEFDKLGRAISYAVRFLDNAIDLTPYFFDENAAQQLGERRVGLGTMGMAEMLIKLGIRYGSEECVEFLDRLYRFIAEAAYTASVDLSIEKGAFPFYDERYLESGFVKQLEPGLREKINKHGIRNVTLLTQAPTGTTGTMAQTSTGIEPYFAFEWKRVGRLGEHIDHARPLQEWIDAGGDPDHVPSHFVTAMDLTPAEHVRVQAAIQRWTDSSISKTCNIPNEYTVKQVGALYQLMYDTGCKGGTVYRDGSRDEQVLYLPQGEEPEEEEAGPVMPDVSARPGILAGRTARQPTPLGTAYITLNVDQEGEPFEVFIQVSKSGSETQALAEAIGRLMSLILRLPSQVPQIDRIARAIKQLRGIGSGRHHGFGPHRVMSLPDAVAQALANLTGIESDATLPGMPEMTNGHDGTKGAGSGIGIELCPECGQATLQLASGCRNCESCGYSEC